MDKDILIKKYLYGELNTEETARLDQLVASDEEFATELEIQSVYYASRSTELKTELHTYKPIAKKYSFNTSIVIFIIFIASLVLGFLVSNYYFDAQPNTAVHFAQQYLAEKHVAPTVLMGEQSDESLWTQSIDLYNDAKYKQAGASFLQASSTGVKTDQALLYAALSYLYANPELQFMAKPILNSLIKKNSIYIEEAKWYLALYSVQHNDELEARKWLEDIVDDKSWNYMKAQKVLDTM